MCLRPYLLVQVDVTPTAVEFPQRDIMVWVMLVQLCSSQFVVCL